ncbi:hypothetical protein ACQP08_10040 [Micromonospora zamorensis]
MPDAGGGSCDGAGCGRCGDGTNFMINEVALADGSSTGLTVVEEQP